MVPDWAALSVPVGARLFGLSGPSWGSVQTGATGALWSAGGGVTGRTPKSGNVGVGVEPPPVVPPLSVIEIRQASGVPAIPLPPFLLNGIAVIT